jgi:hypothetical protein
MDLRFHSFVGWNTRTTFVSSFQHKRFFPSDIEVFGMFFLFHLSNALSFVDTFVLVSSYVLCASILVLYSVDT